MTEKAPKNKTILVIISKNILRRNILETEFWDGFRSANADNKIVLVGEYEMEELYQKYRADNVHITHIQRSHTSLWHRIVLFLVRTGVNSHGVKLYRWRSYTLGEAGLAATLAKSLIASTVANFSWYHHFVRHLYSKLSLDWIEKIYEEHQPDIVFTPSLIDINYDALFGVAARRRQIPVIGMVRSWDNLTIHGLFPFVPDTFIFQNQYLKWCAEHVQSINLSKLQKTAVVGLPHYDAYRFPEGIVKSREEFFAEAGLDPDRKLIFYGGFDFYWSEDLLLHKLDNAIETGQIKESAQIVFRPHPSSPFEIADFKVEALKHTTLNAAFLDKQTAFTDKDFFINLVYHCDVLINIASTLAIDGCVFDRPVICVNFDDPERTLPKWKQVERLYDTFDHYEALMATGCAKLPTSFGELVENIDEYFTDPTLDHEKRQQAVERFVAPFEGDSGKRLVKEVLSAVNEV